MTHQTDGPYQNVREQYRTPVNLNTRITLHQRFSTNPYGWFRWAFDQFQLPAEARILEVGCGPGDVWLENRDRIPKGWQVVLTDASEGMLAKARERLEGVFPFRFEQLDAQSAPYPFEDQAFDAVIADHMLYHLSDRKTALAEIRRILKPGGFFFAATVGENHIKEIPLLVQRFDPELHSRPRVTDSFTLENGERQILEFFPTVQLFRYPDGLRVTEAAPLVAYILSGWSRVPQEKEPQFTKYIEEELASHGGQLEISKDSGMFVARRGRV